MREKIARGYTPATMAAAAKAGGRGGRRSKPAKAPASGGARASAVAKGPAAGGSRKPKAASRGKALATRGAPLAVEAPRPAAPVALTDEERIESAKYTTGDVPRLFEEERFLFPESYDRNRVRLLVKDPHWLFAHWDVAGRVQGDLRASLGERPAALATLTLRVTDPVSGGLTTILLPREARSWYVRTDGAARAYRAELGFTLPSGEFRHLAWSNTVETPRVGPAGRRARRVVRFGAEGSPRGPSGARRRTATRDNPPWAGAPRAQGGPSPERDYAPEAPGEPGARPAPGGASDVFRPGGASDVHRR